MASTPANANGHRRRQLRARILAEETHCALCGGHVDKTLGMLPGQHGARCQRDNCTGCIPHPQRGEVDEDMPRARGGSPYDRTNCRLMHRTCNRLKGTHTIAEFIAKQTQQQAPKVITNRVQW
jgi:5-methylcytosine-specific restriction endonuclease McrA